MWLQDRQHTPWAENKAISLVSEAFSGWALLIHTFKLTGTLHLTYSLNLCEPPMANISGLWKGFSSWKYKVEPQDILQSATNHHCSFPPVIACTWILKVKGQKTQLWLLNFSSHPPFFTQPAFASVICFCTAGFTQWMYFISIHPRFHTAQQGFLFIYIYLDLFPGFSYSRNCADLMSGNVPFGILWGNFEASALTVEKAAILVSG